MPNNIPDSQDDTYKTSEFFRKYMHAKKLPKDTPPESFEQRQADLINFYSLVGEMSSGIQKPLIEIMNANGLPKEQKLKMNAMVAQKLRQTELSQIRQKTKAEAMGQLFGMTINFLDELIKEFDGAFIMRDFIRRAKELRSRIMLENKIQQKRI